MSSAFSQLARALAGTHSVPLRKERKPYACVGCGATIGVKSKYYDEGVCYRCIRLDSSGGAYREYSRKKHRGLHSHVGSDGKTTHLG